MDCLLPDVPVGGRISKFVNFWKKNVTDNWVVSIVEKGYSLEFKSIPPVSKVRQTKISSPQQLEVLKSEVSDLLIKDAIEPLAPAQMGGGFYSTFFVVPKKSGDLRPILNLRPLNDHLQKKSFKMETLQKVIKAVKPKDWLVALDLKDAYLHIPILSRHRKFLRFRIDNQSYQFKVLPFGLTASPRVFTKVLAPLAALARQEGIHVFPYLDDWLIRDNCPTAIIPKIQRLMEILKKAGFIINLKKSHLEPSQDMVFVGGRFITKNNLVALPPERFSSLLSCLDLFKRGSSLPARVFLRLLGLMAAMIFVVPHCRLRMRPIQLYLLAKWDLNLKDLEMQVPVEEVILQHLQWWKNPANVLKGVPLEQQLVQEIVTTDASQLYGWGGHLQNMEVQGSWNSEESRLHINLLEMEAVAKTLQHFENWLTGKVVLVKCDNDTVVSYINKEGGTKSPSLCIKTWNLLLWAQSKQIVLRAEHIPGVQNIRADALSRSMASPLEWRLCPQVVQEIFYNLGSPVIDLFATAENRQTLVYCSRFHDDQAYHVDSLSMNWEGIYAYAFPPICLVPLVLERVEKYDCSVILITPFWPRRSWFPRILDLLIDQPIRLPNRPDLLTQDQGQLHHHSPDKLQLVAWKVSANPYLQRAFQKRLSTQCRIPLGDLQPGAMTACGQYLCVGAIKGEPILARLL